MPGFDVTSGVAKYRQDTANTLINLSEFIVSADKLRLSFFVVLLLNFIYSGVKNTISKSEHFLATIEAAFLLHSRYSHNAYENNDRIKSRPFKKFFLNMMTSSLYIRK